MNKCDHDHSLEYFKKDDEVAEQAVKEYKETALTFCEQFREVMIELGKNSGELITYFKEPRCKADAANKLLHFSYRIDALSAFIEAVTGLYPIAKELTKTRDLALQELMTMGKYIEEEVKL